MKMPMSTITRYMLREYLKFFVMILTLLTLISLIIHFLEKIKTFSERAVSIRPILLYFFYKLPGILFDVMPFVILISTLVTLGAFSRNNEIIAFRSAGISLLTLTMPLIGFALCLSLALFFLNGALFPHMQKEARRVRESLIEKKTDGHAKGRLVQNNIWLRDSRQVLLRAQLIEPEQNRMRGVHLFYLDEGSALLAEVEADSLAYTQAGWMLSEGLDRRFLQDGRVQVVPFRHRPVGLRTRPEDLRDLSVVPDEMTHSRLTDYIDRLSEASLPVARYRVDLYGKQATPFAGFIMALLGIPFALHREKMARGMVLSLSLALSYWLLSALLISFGRALILPAWLAAWGANLTFLAVGCGLFLQAESCGRQSCGRQRASHT